jgi:hypothetical protein
MNEIAIKPSIQHFRLVAETEERIRSFVESFIKSKVIGVEDLLAEERTRWLVFRTRGISIKCLPKELVEKLDLYHYKNGRVYFIYPSLIDLNNNYRYNQIEAENRLIDLYDWIKIIQIFKGPKMKEVLKLIKDKIIIPIRKADYTEGGWYENHCFYKQEDYIRKYNIDLDWFEKKFKKEIESFKEYAKENSSLYHSTKYVVNKYGQPIPIIKEDRCSWNNMKSARIEVDHVKGQLRLITGYYNCRCAILIDIKTNSLVGIKKEPVNNQIL